jgi:ribonuclease P protein component
MFRKNQRLTRSEFTHYFKHARRRHFEHFSLLGTKLEKTPQTLKVAVVVGKKVSKSAVRRNALRRRVYSTARAVLEEVSYRGVLIVILKPSYNQLSRKTTDALLRKSIAEFVKSA